MLLMPRVIEEVPIEEKQVRCAQCGRMIAYVENDVEERHGTDYGGGPDGMRFVRCPASDCPKPIVLKRW